MTKNIVIANVKLDAASCWDSSLKLEFTTDGGEHLSLLADRELALAQFSKSSIISAYQKYPLDLDAAFSQVFQDEEAEIKHQVTAHRALSTEVKFGNRANSLIATLVPAYRFDLKGHMGYLQRVQAQLVEGDEND